jgi:hypothetical protein
MFTILHGALAFFTFDEKGEPACNILAAADAVKAGSVKAREMVMVVEKNQYHAMTAAPPSLGWPGYAVIFEVSGHVYEANKPVKVRYCSLMMLIYCCLLVCCCLVVGVCYALLYL